MTTVLYPGTFNPIHNGHIDLVERASRLFDRIILAIATSPHKKPTNLELRVDLAKQVLGHIENVEVQGFNSLTVDFAKEVGARIILKGIRTATDFEYEFQMLGMNRVLQPGLETIFLAPSDRYSLISSTLVKQIASYGGNITEFVPSCVADALNDGYINLD